MNKLRAITILLVFLSSGVYGQSDTLRFLHLTDTHVIFGLESYHPGIAANRNHYGQGVEPLSHFLQTIPKETNCDFVAITGDLIDFFEGAGPDGTLLRTQTAQFARLLQSSSVPVFPLPGNHDLASYTVRDGKRVSSQVNAGLARASWIRELESFASGTWYSLTRQAGNTTYRLIFLDNGYEGNPEEERSKPFIDEAQMQWLKDQLNQSDRDIEIVLMHIPFVPGKIPEEFFTVLSKVKLILAGHHHTNLSEEITNGKSRIRQVQTGAFGRDPDNWRLIELIENKISVSTPGSTAWEIEILH